MTVFQDHLRNDHMTILRDFYSQPHTQPRCFHLWVCIYIYQPTSPCPTLSAHTKPISQGNCYCLVLDALMTCMIILLIFSCYRYVPFTHHRDTTFQLLFYTYHEPLAVSSTGTLHCSEGLFSSIWVIVLHHCTASLPIYSQT